jgi:hypothetical protein
MPVTGTKVAVTVTAKFLTKSCPLARPFAIRAVITAVPAPNAVKALPVTAAPVVPASETAHETARFVASPGTITGASVRGSPAAAPSVCP